MQSSLCYVAASGCLATSLDDEMIVLDLESGVYYGLNPVSACVWRHLAEPVGLEALVDAVEDEFETAGNDTRADVEDLLATLCAHGLVTEVGVAAAVR